ncbi:hypothetical protein [Methylocystis heyeri]|uniref:Uncharacterized protein n=1 Tax=Methylocystis heyeri TaxID=391905 RepID=A0A6B8KJY3_9HYPH|nr:hypothetical protein [Methylocystis heyeri]QGM46920.1 hypothetical protein H2LOC_015145 [Methylocystis heyeri]
MIDATPDRPVAFGFKMMWFAIRDATPEAVLKALGFADSKPANWATGLHLAAGREHWVFISPPLDRWVFIAGGIWMPHPARGSEWLDGTGRKFDALIGRLLPHFSDVQFFGSYRVTGFVAWMRAIDGKVFRASAFNDSECWENVGAQTPEEAQLQFADLSALPLSEVNDALFSEEEAREERREALQQQGLSHAETRKLVPYATPDEIDLLRLAALWSLDPSSLEEEDHEAGTGFLVRFPPEWVS